MISIAFLLTIITVPLARHMVEGLNDRPIIAILAQLAGPDYKRSYIAASYVKYIEASGGRVVPIPSSMSADEAGEIFENVNGVLFPGGGIRWFTSGYYQHAKMFYDKAIEANKQGDYFPIWGTCLGFETLHVITTGKQTILGNFSASDITIPLNYTDLAPDSRLFKDICKHLYNSLATENITYNHHRKGISPDMYTKEPSLEQFFNVLSVNNGKKGKTFVSTVEAKNFPIYGTQWHPEKNNFEYNTREHIPHSELAIKASQYMSNFIVNEARKNHHKFSSTEEEQKYLIYNYTPEFTGEHGSNFEQCYYFD